jgi:hypothetical protein
LFGQPLWAFISARQIGIWLLVFYRYLAFFCFS